MNENLLESQGDVIKKSKSKKFYETNKILIFSTALILIISIASVSFYLEAQEKKKEPNYYGVEMVVVVQEPPPVIKTSWSK